MIRRTYADLKPELARVCAAAGMPVTDDRLLSYTNLAVEELMNELDHPLFYDRLRFTVYGGRITLPAFYERAVGLKLNDQPMTLQSPWFEYVGWGWDMLAGWNQTNGWLDENALGPGYLSGVLDRDDVCTFKDIPNPALGILYYLRLRTSVDERVSGNMPVAVIVRGYDANGDWVRSQDNAGDWIDGAQFVWTANGSLQVANSAQTFSRIESVTKSLTREPLDCFMIGVTGGTGEIQIGRWEAGVANVTLRRYLIKGLSETQQYCVDARVRRRFIPIVNDSDMALVSNLPAMKEMMMAIYKRDSDDFEKYGPHKESAVDILKKETRSYLGLQRQRPVITMGDGAGVRQDGIYII